MKKEKSLDEKYEDALIRMSNESKQRIVDAFEEKKEGLTFAEAMKYIVEGKAISRSKYHSYRADSLIFKYPRVIIINEENEQSGYWIPTLRDIEATDWRVIE